MELCPGRLPAIGEPRRICDEKELVSSEHPHGLDGDGLFGPAQVRIGIGIGVPAYRPYPYYYRYPYPYPYPYRVYVRRLRPFM